MYGPDPVTSARATVGGGIGNNSCGPHSRALRQDARPHPRGRRRPLGRQSHALLARRGRGAGGQAGAQRPRRHDLPRDAPTRLGALGRDSAALPPHPAPRHGLQPRRLHRRRPHEPHPRRRRLGRHARRRHRSARHLVPLPRYKGLGVVHFTRPHRVHGGVRPPPRAQPVGGRTRRPHDHRQLQGEPRLPQPASTISSASRANCCSSSSTATLRERCSPGSRR